MQDPVFSIGYSPCPNDTFIFCSLASKKILHPGLDFAPPRLADVETLNQWAMNGLLDITKLSFHAYAHVRDRYVLLDAGSALGRGCGPLLVSRHQRLADLSSSRIAVPGHYTTAAMLLRLFAPDAANLAFMPFDRIIPALLAGEVDAGVIIHESRFTYRQHGLFLLQDLGHWWEDDTGLPIPLGGIAARRDFPVALLKHLQETVQKSVQWAFANRAETFPYVKQHAQELAEDVIASHIDLYVNDFSLSLGREGKAAVRAFLARGERAGVFSSSELPIFVEEL